MQKKSILIFSDWFRPAYKAGGPITSIANFCLHMSQHYNISIFTSNRDINDTEINEALETDNWIFWESGVRVYYNSQKSNLSIVQKAINECSPHAIYLNSMFSFDYSLLPLYAINKSKHNVKVVINPRGMLMPGSLSQKGLKKHLFLNLIRKHPIWKRIHWQHSFKEEELESKRYFKEIKSSVILNFPKPLEESSTPIFKPSGEVKLVFTSRITPHKNLLLLLESLKKIEGKVILSIYGPIDDNRYYQLCNEQTQSLPEQIDVKFGGSLPPEKLKSAYQESHFSVLLTKGENFGHSIIESFANHRPVLISNKTPWTGLKDLGLGWDIDINQNQLIQSTIQKMVDMDNKTFQKLSQNCQITFKKLLNNDELVEKYVSLFG